MTSLTQSTASRYWSYALWLVIFTILYNLAEGLISISGDISDETLTLFGFGVDSFIEVPSGIGILAMVLRIRQNPIGFVDCIGGLGLIYFSYNEGIESFEKAAGMADCCDDEVSEEAK